MARGGNIQIDCISRDYEVPPIIIPKRPEAVFMSLSSLASKRDVIEEKAVASRSINPPHRRVVGRVAWFMQMARGVSGALRSSIIVVLYLLAVHQYKPTFENIIHDSLSNLFYIEQDIHKWGKLTLLTYRCHLLQWSHSISILNMMSGECDSRFAMTCEPRCIVTAIIPFSTISSAIEIQNSFGFPNNIPRLPTPVCCKTKVGVSLAILSKNTAGISLCYFYRSYYYKQ